MLFSSQVWAHSDIAMTMPENEAILEAVPEEITIHMGKPIRLIYQCELKDCLLFLFL